MGYCKKHTPRLLFQRKYSKVGRKMLYRRAEDVTLPDITDVLNFYSEIAPCGVESNIDTIEELIKSLPSTHGNDWGELNKAFLSVLE